MSESLYVSNEEFANIQNEISSIQTRFKSLNSEFESKLLELQNYWSGVDYDAMANNIKSNMLPITGENGSINSLMTDMLSTLEQKSNEYANIQRKNMGYWG